MRGPLDACTTIVTDDSEVDALLMQRPGESPLLVLRPHMSFQAAVSAVTAAVPGAHPDDVRALVRRHLPAAPDLDSMVGETLATVYAPAPRPVAAGRLPMRARVGILGGIGALVLGSVFAAATSIRGEIDELRDEIAEHHAEQRAAERHAAQYHAASPQKVIGKRPPIKRAAPKPTAPPAVPPDASSAHVTHAPTAPALSTKKPHVAAASSTAPTGPPPPHAASDPRPPQPGPRPEPEPEGTRGLVSGTVDAGCGLVHEVTGQLLDGAADSLLDTVRVCPPRD